MEGIPPHKRAGANRCIRHPTPLSAAARAGYECAQVPAYRRHAHRRSSQRAQLTKGRWLWLKPFARRPSYVKLGKMAGRARTTSRRSGSAGAVKRAARAPRRRRKRANCKLRQTLIPATRPDLGRAQSHRPRYPAPDGDGADSVRAAASERKTPPTAGLKFWDERTQRVVELVPPTAMRNLARGSAVSKKFFGGSPPR